MTTKHRAKVPQPILNPPQLFGERRASSAPAPVTERYEVPGLALTCQKCGATVGHYDATGSAWCDGCEARCKVINQGFYAAWPASRSGRVVIPVGRNGWMGFAKGAPDAVVTAMLGTLKGQVAA